MLFLSFSRAFLGVGAFGSPGAGTYAEGVMGTRLAAATDAVWAALAPRTRTSYFSKVQDFCLFCQASALPEIWPIQISFIMHLRESGYSVQSVVIYLAALAFCAKATGWSDFSRILENAGGFQEGSPPLPDHLVDPSPQPFCTGWEWLSVSNVPL